MWWQSAGVMFFPRTIRWLAGFPAPFALGILWWAEVTIDLCSITGGYFLSSFIYNNLPPRYDEMLFPLALLTFLLVFFFIYLAFGNISLLMEALLNIHRIGGKLKAEELHRIALKEKDSGTLVEKSGTKINDPYGIPERIRASAGAFKIRYFIVFPTAVVLYLLIYASTIYRIFTRQIQSLDPGNLVLPALGVSIFATVCYWLLLPHVPGSVSVPALLGLNPKDREEDNKH
jgi:hypothetical protein